MHSPYCPASSNRPVRDCTYQLDKKTRRLHYPDMRSMNKIILMGATARPRHQPPAVHTTPTSRLVPQPLYKPHDIYAVLRQAICCHLVAQPDLNAHAHSAILIIRWELIHNGATRPQHMHARKPVLHEGWRQRIMAVSATDVVWQLHLTHTVLRVAGGTTGCTIVFHNEAVTVWTRRGRTQLATSGRMCRGVPIQPLHCTLWAKTMVEHCAVFNFWNQHPK